VINRWYSYLAPSTMKIWQYPPTRTLEFHVKFMNIKKINSWQGACETKNPELRIWLKWLGISQ
jgi:hypothetical protein